MDIVRADGLRWVKREGTDDHLASAAHEPALQVIFREEFDRMVNYADHREAHEPPGGWFLDVGAHVGRYAVRAAARGIPTIAVEPNLSSVWALNENARLNLSRSVAYRLMVLPVAAWNESTCIDLHEPEDATRRSPASYSVHGVPRTTKLREVPAYPLDQLVHVPIAFVKIDVEGAEDRVLAGMAAILVSSRPRMVIETHGAYYGKEIDEEVAHALAAFHYDVEEVGTDGASRYLRAAPR